MVAAEKKLELPLKEVLKETIRLKGPQGVDAFHASCLYHPLHGYYQTQAVLGQCGDFTTAPEVSPLFGDIVGAFFLNQWLAAQSPSALTIIELGPGLGTLMEGLLRVGKLRPAFLKAIDLRLVDVHPLLKKEQRKKLAPFASVVNSMKHCASVEEIACADGPVFVLANEFFDVLPHKQYQKKSGAWAERVVDLDPQGEFSWKHDAQSVPQRADPALLARYAEGMVYEESQALDAAMHSVCCLLQKQGGCALLIDYGYSAPALTQEGFLGDSWQGLLKGQHVSPFAYPGCADLSFHVNFKQLALCAEKAGHKVALQTQRDFLYACGLKQRLEALRPQLSAKEYAVLEAGVLRLTHPLQMGTLFKVLTLQAVPQT